METSAPRDASSGDNGSSEAPTLLSREQELELSEAIQAGALAESRLSAEAPGPGRDDLERAVERGKKARADFVEANQRLVHWVVRKNSRRFANRGLSHDEMVAAGIRGLATAVERFDGTRGVRFSTFAVRGIEWSVDRALRRAGADARRARRNEEREELQRRLEAERRAAEAAAARFRPEVLGVAARVLDERGHLILVRRRGLDGGAVESLRELAPRLGLSHEYVRVLENRAVNRLRRCGLLSDDAIAWLDNQGNAREK